MPVELNILESVTELDTTVVTVVLESASEPGPAGPGVPTGGTAGQVLTKDSGTDFDTSWQDSAGGPGGGAPSDADYLVGTANGDLSNEIVVGTSPGGELGGTWASPTVDATHSGSSHASVQAAAEATAASELSAHASDTTGIHGIADTANLLDTGDIGTTVQAFDADLSTYAGITPSANVQSILGAANYAAIRTLLSLVVGTNVQAWDADLDTYAGITPSANVQSLLAAANYAAMRALLDLEAGTDFPSLTTFNDHSARHEDGGADEISLTGLSGVPADVQPLDSDLTAIAGLSPTNDDILQRKAGAWTNRTIAQLLTDLAAAGTTFQPLDATLTALAAANWAANNLPIGSGADTLSQVSFAANTFPARASTGNLVAKTITDFALTVLDDTDQATARTTLGVGTGDSPQFTAVNVGAASDTTITRTGAGDIAVEGNGIYRAGGTDVPLADGGTGASLADPNADRIMFWDDSAGAVTWLTAGTNLTITGTTIDASGSGGGDADLTPAFAFGGY